MHKINFLPTKLKLILGIIIGALIYQIFVIFIFITLLPFVFLVKFSRSNPNSKGGRIYFCLVVCLFIYLSIVISSHNYVVDHSPSFFADYLVALVRSSEGIQSPTHAFLFALLESLNIFDLTFPSQFTGIFSATTLVFTSSEYIYLFK